MHESLTKKNRELMFYAAQLKQQRCLAAAFTIRGRVFIRKKKGEQAKQVFNKGEVDSFIAS